MGAAAAAYSLSLLSQWIDHSFCPLGTLVGGADALNPTHTYACTHPHPRKHTQHTERHTQRHTHTHTHTHKSFHPDRQNKMLSHTHTHTHTQTPPPQQTRKADTHAHKHTHLNPTSPKKKSTHIHTQNHSPQRLKHIHKPAKRREQLNTRTCSAHLIRLTTSYFNEVKMSLWLLASVLISVLGWK